MRTLLRLLAALIPLAVVELLAELAGYVMKFRSDVFEYAAASRVRGLYWQLHFGSRKLFIARNVILECRSRIRLGSNVKLHAGVQISAPGPGIVSIGPGTHISRLSTLAGAGGIDIGKACAIGAHVSILSVSADGRETLAGAARIAKPVIIEDGAFIGAGVRILPGVSIGRNATIGANSVVTKDVPAGAIAFGVPARVQSLKPGFDDADTGEAARVD